MHYCQTINEFKKRLIPGKAIICIDYGSRKIGTSISSPNHTFAMPYKVLTNKSNPNIMLEIIKIIKDKNICGIVIGYPIEGSGKEGEACKLVRAFVEKMSVLIPEGLPYFYQDERLSTKLAKAMLGETGLKRKEKDAIDDQVAALNILQTVLNLLKN